MKKFLFTLILSVSSILNAFSFSRDDIKSYTLENGLKIYFLQDTGAAPVRIELNINAGFSNQTERNGRFFEVYAHFLNLEIDADVVRTVKTVAPGDVENTFIELTQYFKPLNVTDRELRGILSEQKAVLNEFSSSAAGFINKAIDSKVFASSPWKQESGVNPVIFSLTSTAQARAIMEQIGQEYYSPKNSSIYISGNITENTVLALTEKYFGRRQNASRTESFSLVQDELFSIPENKRKFVLTDEELSDELTQIVIQYTGFSRQEADIMSWAMDNNYGPFKTLLLKQKNLAIRAPDYINASSAQTKNSSRLIIQSILEKSKVGPVIQAQLFLEMSREPDRFSQQDFNFQASNYDAFFNELKDNSTSLMEAFAEWNAHNSNSNIFDRTASFASLNATELEIKYLEQTPFVFVLVNSNVYAKYAGDFKKAGYTTLTRKNAPWYSQEQYKKYIQDKNSAVKTAEGQKDAKESSYRYITENKNQLSSKTLSNGIPVTIKYTPESKNSAILLTISGGELLFADKTPGLCSVLTNALASNIRWQLDARIARGLLKTTTNITARTNAEYSVLEITCASDETEECLRAALDSIIYSDITPALADGICYDLRTQWRIQTGNPEYQLLCEAVRTMYSKPYTNLFQDTKDKPVQLEYTQIATSYPLFLDSTRFSLVIAGGTQDSETLTAVLNETFGLLTTNKSTASIGEKVKKPSVPQKAKKLQLRHQFFTDISADKAGPRPAVLIPTTDFSDPLVYIFESPDPATTDSALFNALLFELQDRLQKKVSSEQVVKVAVPSVDLPFAQIKITKIKHTAQTDRIYAETVTELITDLENLVAAKDENVIDTEKDRLLATMENRWLMNTLSDTTSARGTARLIQEGMMLKNPSLYLDQYEAITNAQAADYYIVAKAFLEKIPALRMYSADSKK